MSWFCSVTATTPYQGSLGKENAKTFWLKLTDHDNTLFWKLTLGNLTTILTCDNVPNIRTIHNRQKITSICCNFHILALQTLLVCY